MISQANLNQSASQQVPLNMCLFLFIKISQANLNQSASQQVMSNLKFEKAEESKNANFISVKIQLKEDGSNAQQFYGEINRILSSQGYSDWDKLKHLEIINVFKFIPAKFAQEMATIGLLANRIEQILLKVQNANRGVSAIHNATAAAEALVAKRLKELVA